jgi:hypothetical protein
MLVKLVIHVDLVIEQADVQESDFRLLLFCFLYAYIQSCNVIRAFLFSYKTRVSHRENMYIKQRYSNKIR